MFFSEELTTQSAARMVSGVEAYWEALRPSAGVPSRAAIDPRGLEAVLDYTFILERVSPGLTRFRLAGHRVSDLLGASVEGVPFTALCAPNCQLLMAKSIESVFCAPAVFRGELIAPKSFGRPEIQASLSLMPLRHDDGSISRALGVLVPTGRLGRTPRHFETFTHNLTRLVVADPVEVREHALGMAESAPEYAIKKERPAFTGRPNLKVIQGSKP